MKRRRWHAPNIWRLEDLRLSCETFLAQRWTLDGWQRYPARPLGLDTIPHRIRAAWLVFTGRADAVIWPHGQ